LKEFVGLKEGIRRRTLSLSQDKGKKRTLCLLKKKIGSQKDWEGEGGGPPDSGGKEGH